MINNKFKKIYKLIEKKQLKNYKKEYKELLCFDNEIGNFKDYIAKLKDSRQDSYIKNNHYKDAIIFTDIVKKESLLINLYLIKFKHIFPPELDKEYKPLPLKEQIIYEYGAIITLEDTFGEYTIENAFSGTENAKELAEIKYQNLKEELKEMTEEKVIDKLERYILSELNAE